VHRTFKKLLPGAHGDTELVVAINLDIRGYTRFSESVDSVLALLYMRKVFEKLTADYFKKASFFKSTGDGLLLVVPWEDHNLELVVAEVVADSFRLMREFPNLCANDPAINFPVPDRLGIGLSRGSASLLRTRRTILDYSGRPLNLASRLMEVARPAGIVADDAFGIDLLPADLRARFTPDEVYIHGVAEREPFAILYSNEYTTIGAELRRPIQEVAWEKILKIHTLRQIRDMGATFRWSLPSKPLDPDEIHVSLRVGGRAGGKRVKGVEHPITVPHQYDLEAGNPTVIASHDAAVQAALDYGTPINSKATLRIDYPKG
jgi:class 3 adenylate cyclase